MQKLNILPKKKVKEIFNLIEKQFGIYPKIDYAFLQNERGRIYIVNREISKIDLEKVRINSLGLYFGEIRNNFARLSIEGSQLIGSLASKNVLEIDDKQARQWMAGEDLQIEGDYSGFVLVKNKKDFLGCGKSKEGKLFNFVGKSRRISLS